MKKKNTFNFVETMLIKMGHADVVEHQKLIEEVVDKLDEMLSDRFVDRLNECTHDELKCINSRLTMIINKLKEKEVKWWIQVYVSHL